MDVRLRATAWSQLSCFTGAEVQAVQSAQPASHDTKMCTCIELVVLLFFLGLEAGVAPAWEACAGLIVRRRMFQPPSWRQLQSSVRGSVVNSGGSTGDRRSLVVFVQVKQRYELVFHG